MKFVCSNRQKPTVHSGRKGGNQWWKRDIFHATEDGQHTLCGIKCGEYLVLDIKSVEDGGTDDFCGRCQTKAYGAPIKSTDGKLLPL